MTHNVTVDSVAALFGTIAKTEGVDSNTGIPVISVFNPRDKKTLVNLTDETIFLANEKGVVVQVLDPHPLEPGLDDFDTSKLPCLIGNTVFIITEKAAALLISDLQKTGRMLSNDILVPDTGKSALRNEQGELLAIRCLKHYVTGDVHTSYSLIGE